MVLEHNVTLANDTVVMYVPHMRTLERKLIVSNRVWISSANAAAVAEKNFRIVHGPSDYFYLVRDFPLHAVQNLNSCVLDRIAAQANGLEMTPQGMFKTTQVNVVRG